MTIHSLSRLTQAHMGAERDVWAGIRFTCEYPRDLVVGFQPRLISQVKWTSVSPAATPIYHLFTPRLCQVFRRDQ